MIPTLKRYIAELSSIPEDSVSLIKLHNGYAQRQPKVGFVVFHNTTPTMFLKLSRDRAHDIMIEQGYQNLTQAHSWIADHSLNVRHPTPLWIDRIQGTVVSAETIVQGRALNPQSTTEVQLAMNYLQSSIHTSTEATIAVDTLITTWLSEIKHASVVEREEIRKQYNEISTQNLSLPVIPQHGDATHSNFLLHGDRLGLIDWDRFGEITVPLFDVLTFIERITPKHANPLNVHADIISRSLQHAHLSKAHLPIIVFLFALGTEWRKTYEPLPYETLTSSSCVDSIQRVMQWLKK